MALLLLCGRQAGPSPDSRHPLPDKSFLTMSSKNPFFSTTGTPLRSLSGRQEGFGPIWIAVFARNVFDNALDVKQARPRQDAYRLVAAAPEKSAVS
jgi:hypothetical protein